MSAAWGATRVARFAAGRDSIDPATHRDQVFELFSIPSYDTGQSEIIAGAAVGSSKLRVRPGDVLVSKIVPHIQRVWIVPSNRGYEQIASTEWIVLRVSGDPRYFRYQLLGSEFHSQFLATVEGMSGSLRRARPRDVFNIVLHVPSSAEQRAIAEFLDRETQQIDELIAEQRGLIETLRERKQSVFASRLRQLTTTTSGQRLKHVVEAVRQGWSPQCYPWPADGVSEWGVLKAGATNHGVFRPDENKTLPPDMTPRENAVVRDGEIVIGRASTKELVGGAAVVRGNYPKLMLSDKLFSLRLDETRACPEYVAAVLTSPLWRGMIRLAAQGTSHSMQNVGRDDFLELPMDLPTLSEQTEAIVWLKVELARIDALITESEDLIVLSLERRGALITAAVTGQLRIGPDGQQIRVTEAA